MVKYNTTASAVASLDKSVTGLPRGSGAVKSGDSCPTSGPVIPATTVGRLSSPEGVRSSVMSPHPAANSTKIKNINLTKDMAHPQCHDICGRKILAPAVLLDGVTPDESEYPIPIHGGKRNDAGDGPFAKPGCRICPAVDFPMLLLQV